MTIPANSVSIALYGTVVGTARWDGPESKWDGAGVAWGYEDWNSIECELLSARVGWGCDDTLGVLTQSAAGTFAFKTYDPDRKLDPLNAGSFYRPLMVPGTPLQLNYGPTLIRRGYLDELDYSYADQGGRVTGSDCIARLAQSTTSATFHPTMTTLEKFAKDVIANVGLPIATIRVNLATDPTIAIVQTESKNAWDLIHNAATDALCLVYTNAWNDLCFSPYGAPTDTGVTLGDGGIPLEDLVSFSTERGIVNVVRDAVGELGRDAASVTLHGPRTFSVDRTEPGGVGWGAAIVADRANASLEVLPGNTLPRDGTDLGALAQLDGNELVHINLTRYGIVQAGQVVGGSWDLEGGDVWRAGVRMYIPGSEWDYNPGTTPETRTFPCTKDATVQNYSGTSFLGAGAGDRLFVQSWDLSTGAASRMRAFLSGWNLDLTGARKYVRARLRVYGDRNSQPGAITKLASIDLRRIVTAWTEGSSTNPDSSNAVVWPGPSVTDSGMTAAAAIPTTDGWFEVDVTEIVRAWIPLALGGSNLPELGIAIYAAPESTNPQRLLYLFSRERGSTLAPRLLVDVEV